MIFTRRVDDNNGFFKGNHVALSLPYHHQVTISLVKNCLESVTDSKALETSSTNGADNKHRCSGFFYQIADSQGSFTSFYVEFFKVNFR